MGRKKPTKKGKAKENPDSHEVQENELRAQHRISVPRLRRSIYRDSALDSRIFTDNRGASDIRGNPSGELTISPIEGQGRNDLPLYGLGSSSPVQHLPHHLQSSEVLSGGFFGRAQDVEITGGSFEETRGDRNNVTIHFNVKGSREDEYGTPQQRHPISQASTSSSSKTSENISDRQEETILHVQSDQRSVPSVSMTEYSPDNSNVIYERHLKLKKRGFPLWIPGPNMLLPKPYRRRGVDIGDVGIITSSGGFFFLFNIRLPPNDPLEINPPVLPEGFSPIFPPIGPLDLCQYPEFDPGGYLASTHIERIHEDPPSPGLSFKTSAAEGAILTLPEGAIALDLRNIPRFEAYAAANIESWYRYANGPRGLQAKNGDIRLVIGCDKATSWGVAAVANLTQHKTHHLKYRPSENSDGRSTSVSTIPLYRWEYSGIVEARVGPHLREIEELKRNDDSDLAIDGKYWNQSLFLRTLNVTLNDGVFDAINKEVQLALIQESQQFRNAGGSNSPTNVARDANSGSISTSQQSGAISGNQQSSGSELSGPSTGNDNYVGSVVPIGKERVIMTISPSAPQSHPADLLNKLLLRKAKGPNIRVVVTQDKHWYSVITDDDEVMPNAAELAERVLAAHHIREVDGVVHLEPKHRPSSISASHSYLDLPIQVAHPMTAAASEETLALAQAPGELSSDGGARQQAYEALAVESSVVEDGADSSDIPSDKDAYSMPGERVGPAGAEEEWDTYSGTTPIHTRTPPLIFQPLQKSPQHLGLLFVNHTPNLTPRSTPPSRLSESASQPGTFIPGPGRFPPLHGQGQASGKPSSRMYYLQRAQLVHAASANASRDNVTRRSMSSSASTSSQTTTASLKSTRSRATDDSSATSASAWSKVTTGEGEGFETAVGEEFAEVIFGGQFATTEVVTMNAEAGINLADRKQDQRLNEVEDNEALEENDPLSPLPTETNFRRSISPQTDEKTIQHNRRHSLPPLLTSGSAQMGIALSMVRASRVRLSDVDAQPAVAEEPSHRNPVNTSQVLTRTIARSRSASSTRAVGKHSSFSTSTTKAMRWSSSTRSASRTQSAVGSSLGKGHSRSHELGLGLGLMVGLVVGLWLGLGMTTTAAQATTVPSATTKTIKPAVRGKAKFSLDHEDNKTSAALLELRRHSLGMISKGRAKQREEEGYEEEVDEDGGAVPHNSGDGDDDDDETVDLGELNTEKPERKWRETEEKERERMHLQEQARRAALAEEEKERRRQAEQHQRQLDTIAALTSPATADKLRETRRKWPRFNIGSNSDDGMGEKSEGSGSEVGRGAGGQSVGADTAIVGSRKSKGKEREMSLQQRLAMQQKEYQRQSPQQPQYQQQQHHAKHSTSQYVHGNRQPSKPEFHQLQIMEQTRLDRQRATAAQPQAPLYQQQLQNPEPQQPVVIAIENSSISQKGKQHERAAGPSADSSTKPKSNSRMRDGRAGVSVVNPATAAPIQDSLNTPLVLSMESEFETTDDEGDDGEWSSAEMTADDEEVRQAQEEQEQNRLLLLEIQQQHDRQMQLLQQQRREQAARRQAPQRTPSSHYPAPNNARGNHQTRAQIQRQVQAQAQAQALVDQAVIEAQRQREMFVKLPTSSFQDLAKARTNSVGLLTQLMNPDLENFLPNHLYRRGFSSGELRRSGISASTPKEVMTPVVAWNSSQSSPALTPAANADQSPVLPTVITPQPMQTITSAPAPSDAPSVAVSVASSTSRPVETRRNTADVIPNRADFSPPLRSGYKPRGPPNAQEMEEENDSDDGVIQISKSVAQEKLKALAERRSKAEEEEAPLPPATAYINVDYPYNLPLPIPPSTPRTTRRNMLATELTESLRSNVLWHRHVDLPNPAIRRTTSGSGGRNNVLGEVRSLTAAPSMVQLHAKGTRPEGTAQITRPEPLTDREREEARQRRLTKNKSLANDYHYSGW